MRERVKQLRCMFGVTEIIRSDAGLEEIFRQVVELIPAGWHFPESTRGKINFDGKVYVSAPFEESEWKQISDIIVNGERRGSIEVYYLQEFPQLDEGPFMIEERNLIDGIARAISEAIELKQTELMLQRSEDQFRQMVEETNILLWEADIRTVQFTYMSPQAERITGFTSEQWCQPGFWSEHIYPEDKGWVVNFCQESTLKREDHVFEYRLVKADGTIIWVHDNVKIICDGGGTPVKLRGVMVDVSDRKQVEQALQDSEAKLKLALESARMSTWEWNVKTNLASTRGFDSGDAIDTYEKWIERLHPDDRQRVINEFNEVLKHPERRYEMEYRVIDRGGKLRWMSSRAEVICDEHGEANYIVGANIDITENKQTALRFQQIFDSSPNVLLIINGAGQIVMANEQAVSTFGYAQNELMRMKLDELLPEHVQGKYPGHDQWHKKTREKIADQFLSGLCKDGNEVPIEIAMTPIESGIEGLILMTITDISERVKIEEKLNYQASFDALTGLVNRYEFENRAQRLLSTMAQDNSEHALCFMDLDQFKVVNDSCGHAAGDELLRQLSMVLQKVVRKRDTLARLGGDEFAVLMEHCSLEHAQRVAKSLQRAIQEYEFNWEGHVFKVGVSVGLVAVTELTPNLTELLKEADAACYMAKDLGRNRIHIYHGEDKILAQRHGEMQWVERIHRALDQQRFCLYAQTIVPLGASNDIHYELLLRMIDEKGNLTPPGAFLTAAERYNLIEKLDSWVIEKTFTLLAAHPVFLKQVSFVSINLSGQSLTTPDILNFIITKLDAFGIAAEKICFEITETAAIANLSTAIKFIATLRGLGCRFALDDFGSGLSSFAYLKNLRVDYLKIDGMFVKDIVDDPIDRAMVKSINEIGHVMGMQTIAEFVENDEIKDMLREIGVDYAQGYGIAEPQSFDEILARSANVSKIKRPRV